MISSWVDALPAGWRAGRLDHVANAWPSNVDKHTVEGQVPVRLCNYTDVYNNHTISAELDFMSASATQEQVDRFRLRRGDTVITKDSETSDDIGVPAFVDYEASDLVCGYHLAIVRPSGSVNPRFLYWVMASQTTKSQWAVLASGVTRVGIRSTDLKKVAIPIPPKGLQHAIARYLDHETARIQGLITEQQRLANLLRERRAAMVDNALQHGHQVRLRRLVNPTRPMTYGILQCGEPVTEGVPYIGPSDILGEGMSPSVSNLRRTTYKIAAAYSRSVLKEGDVVTSIGPAYGKVAVVSAELNGANLTQDTVRLALLPDLIDTRYAVWALLSPSTTQFWDREIMGATFRRLNLGTLARTPIPLPPLREQRRLAAYLDEQTRRVDAMIHQAERIIELARERRLAIITGAVTGQIDVGSAFLASAASARRAG